MANSGALFRLTTKIDADGEANGWSKTLFSRYGIFNDAGYHYFYENGGSCGNSAFPYRYPRENGSFSIYGARLVI